MVQRKGIPENLAVQGFFWAMTANISFVVVMVLNRLFRMHLPLHLLIWGRCAFALMLIIPFVRWKSICYLWRTQCIRGLLVGGALVCSYTAYRHLPVHVAVLIGATGPLFTTFLARFFLKEKVDQKRWIVMMMGYIGIVILSHNAIHEGGWSIFILVAFMGNILAAIIGITSRWLALKGASPQVTMLYGLGIPCILTTVGLMMDSIFKITDPVSLTSQQWLFLMAVGAMGALIQYATFRAMMVAKASFVAPLEYTRIFLMIPVGYVFLNEIPTLWSYVGGVSIILTSLCLVVWESKKV